MIEGVDSSGIVTSGTDAHGYGISDAGVAFGVRVYGKDLAADPVAVTQAFAQLVSNELRPPGTTLLDLSGCQLPPIGTACQ